ncbi:MAG: 3-deoxy-manno-octulosonate cytidylyltransferase [Chitinophagaceae bacterium]|nr:MAG: 3-deoxy-manno-octulosonate cytidylyltransferase [Chitinophagaceae bacterium]
MANRKIAIIPARYGSTRFPGKPLALISNKSMIQRVYENCISCGIFDDVIIATDDERILNHAATFGANAVKTDKYHPNGTLRCIEVVEKINLKEAWMFNIQGDEPFLHHENLNELSRFCSKVENAVVTMYDEIETLNSYQNPNVVKLVQNKNQKVNYFSRAPIPFDINNVINFPSPYVKRHIGIYAFSVSILQKIKNLEISALAQIENLEQLTWLNEGIDIYAVEAKHPNGPSVDSPDDIQKAEIFLADH